MPADGEDEQGHNDRTQIFSSIKCKVIEVKEAIWNTLPAQQLLILIWASSEFLSGVALIVLFAILPGIGLASFLNLDGWVVCVFLSSRCVIAAWGFLGAYQRNTDMCRKYFYALAWQLILLILVLATIQGLKCGCAGMIDKSSNVTGAMHRPRGDYYQCNALRDFGKLRGEPFINFIPPIEAITEIQQGNIDNVVDRLVRDAKEREYRKLVIKRNQQLIKKKQLDRAEKKRENEFWYDKELKKGLPNDGVTGNLYNLSKKSSLVGQNMTGRKVDANTSETPSKNSLGNAQDSTNQSLADESIAVTGAVFFENPHDDWDTSQDKYLSRQFKDERSEVGLAHAACLWEKCIGPKDDESTPVVCKTGNNCEDVKPQQLGTECRRWKGSAHPWCFVYKNEQACHRIAEDQEVEENIPDIEHHFAKGVADGSQGERREPTRYPIAVSHAHCAFGDPAEMLARKAARSSCRTFVQIMWFCLITAMIMLLVFWPIQYKFISRSCADTTRIQDDFVFDSDMESELATEDEMEEEHSEEVEQEAKVKKEPAKRSKQAKDDDEGVKKKKKQVRKDSSV